MSTVKLKTKGVYKLVNSCKASPAQVVSLKEAMPRTLYQEWVQGPHLAETRSVADSFVNLEIVQCSQKYADFESRCEISNVHLLDIVKLLNSMLTHRCFFAACWQVWSLAHRNSGMGVLVPSFHQLQCHY